MVRLDLAGQSAKSITSSKRDQTRKRDVARRLRAVAFRPASSILNSQTPLHDDNQVSVRIYVNNRMLGKSYNDVRGNDRIRRCQTLRQASGCESSSADGRGLVDAGMGYGVI